MRLRAIATAGLGLAGAASPALAHTGHDDAAGFIAGFVHPFGGLDHVLAMVAVGLFAARLGGRALLRVPAAFVAFMAVGGALGMNGVALAHVEVGIALSVVAFGLVVAAGVAPPVGIAAALAGFFAVFHGYAHGAETPGDASSAMYAAGFVCATAALHGAGIAAGRGAARLADARLVRFGGAAMAVAGVGLLAGWI